MVLQNCQGTGTIKLDPPLAYICLYKYSRLSETKTCATNVTWQSRFSLLPIKQNALLLKITLQWHIHFVYYR